MKLEITEEEIQGIDGKGLEIEVPGFNGNPQGGGQIWIEVYEDKLKVCIWNKEQDPLIIPIDRV